MRPQTRVASYVSAALTATAARAGGTLVTIKLWSGLIFRRRMSCHARVLVQVFNIGESHVSLTNSSINIYVGSRAGTAARK